MAINQNNSAASTVYYLPGYGGQLATGLGEALMARGWAVAGRETVADFKALPFQQQVDVVADDLAQHFWHENARVVAVSFGAYLFLHAQAQLPPYLGNVLLLSPIVGEFSSGETGMNFVPPYPDRLAKLAITGQYPSPQRCHIHVGSEDWQSCPDNVSAFAAQVGMGLTVVPDAGHQLGKEYVGPVLDRWLSADLF